MGYRVCEAGRSYTNSDVKLPDKSVAPRAFRAVVQHILQGKRKGQALCVGDVQVCDVVIVVYTHKHLVF